jgi:hypothetical protein
VDLRIMTKSRFRISLYGKKMQLRKEVGEKSNLLTPFLLHTIVAYCHSVLGRCSSITKHRSAIFYFPSIPESPLVQKSDGFSPYNNRLLPLIL